ncbi:MAG: transposon-encoded TnpW family protein [Oscillospiraceae bacterium]
MDENTASVTEKVIGDTLYIIESAVSRAAKETAYDKLKRLILNESESQKIKLAS